MDDVSEAGSESQSFVVALKNSSRTLHIDFRYDPLQSNPTARIELELADVSQMCIRDSQHPGSSFYVSGRL